MQGIQQNNCYFSLDYVKGFNDGVKAQYETDSKERLGQWISQEYMSEIDSFIYTEYKCSNCGEISKKKSNYCPNCGSKMEHE